eukprot:8619835-Ditylum_brightwellii.AAC.1
MSVEGKPWLGLCSVAVEELLFSLEDCSFQVAWGGVGIIWVCLQLIKLGVSQLSEGMFDSFVTKFGVVNGFTCGREETQAFGMVVMLSYTKSNYRMPIFFHNNNI